MKLVLADMLVQSFRYHLVHGLGEALLAIHPLDHGKGNHSLAETFEIGVALALGKLLPFNFCVIRSFNLHCEFEIEIVDLVL